MIDNELLQQVLRLDEAARRELRAAIDSSLNDGDVDPVLASFLDVRIAHVDQNPNDRLTVDELKKHLRETRDGTRASLIAEVSGLSRERLDEVGGVDE